MSRLLGPRLLRRGVLALAFGVLLSTAAPVAAQTPLPTMDAAKFMGTWALVFEGGPQGAFTITVAVKDEGGHVAAETSSDFDATPISVKDISKAGDNLVLKYAAGPDGAFAIKLTLTPDADDKLKGAVEAGDGQFSMTGAGGRKK